jgi:hypothetical protein
VDPNDLTLGVDHGTAGVARSGGSVVLKELYPVEDPGALDHPRHRNQTHTRPGKGIPQHPDLLLDRYLIGIAEGEPGKAACGNLEDRYVSLVVRVHYRGPKFAALLDHDLDAAGALDHVRGGEDVAIG